MVSWKLKVLEMKKYDSIKKTSLKVIIPFSIVLFFSFPGLIYYVSGSFSSIKKNTAEILVVKQRMESIYIDYSKQAKNRKNLFIRGFRKKDLDKYSKKIEKSSAQIYKEMDILFKDPLFDKYTSALHKIKKSHIFLIQKYYESIDVYVYDNFDYHNADELTRGHGKEIGQNVLDIINLIQSDLTKKTEDKYSDLTNKLLYLSLIILLGYSIVMYYIIRGILNPLTRITKLSSYLSYINTNHLKDYKEYEKDKNDEIGDLITTFNKFSNTIVDYNKNLQSKILQRTAELDYANEQLLRINKNLTDAMDYSSLLQDAIRPHKLLLSILYEDGFLTWKPKSKVGGDIYFIDVLNKDENKSLVMCIDCTGHSISGAFVTMIVKSIQHELINKLNNKKMEISPGKILGYFNRRIKDILQQYNNTSKSNAGFDGGILYIDKRAGLLKYAGAMMNLIILDEKNCARWITSNRYSVGYPSCKYDYEYEETLITFKKEIKVYLTTDGVVDTISEKKELRFGKKRLLNMINKNHHKIFKEQKNIYTSILDAYRGKYEVVDDICFIGLKIKKNVLKEAGEKNNE